MKILVCDPVSPKGIALLQQRPEFEVVVLPKRLSEAELLPVVKDVVAMVVRSETKVTRKVIEAAPQLRVVGRAGVGVDNVDVEAATQRGVVVMNTPGGNTISTAELSFAMILSLARKVPQAHASMAAGKWDRKQFQGTELAGKTLGVLGMGRIGSEVAKRALAFGMNVLGYDPFLTEARAKALGIELVGDLDDVYRDADFITVHMPVTDQTRGMLNAAAFAKMKPKVCLVNCARGEIIVENDLLAALDSGKVAAVALDVYATEPLPAEHPFRKHPGITLTPHLGASTQEAQEKCGIEVAEVIAGYLLTGEVRNAVNLPYLDAKTYEQVKPYLTLGREARPVAGPARPAAGGPPAHHLWRQGAGIAEHRPGDARHPAGLPVARLGERPQQRQRAQHRLDAGADGGGEALERAGHVQRMAARAGFPGWREGHFRRRHVLRLAGQPAHRARVQPADGDCAVRRGAAAEQQGPARHGGLPGHAAGPAQG